MAGRQGKTPAVTEQKIAETTVLKDKKPQKTTTSAAGKIGKIPDPEELKQRYLDDSNTLLQLPGLHSSAQTSPLREQTQPADGQKTDSSSGNLHGEHRKRLRQRFLFDGGFQNFSDHEILELLLYYVYTRKDTNPIAHNLLKEYDTLKNVLEARPESLMDVPGVGEQAATLISMVVPLTQVWERCAMNDQRRIGNRKDAEQYCKYLLEGKRNEQFYVVCLNAQCQLVGKRCIAEGSLSEVAAYPRMVVETALNHNAHSILLSHNHPGGTCAPSPEDINSTLQLQRLLNGLNIMVLDHIIVAGKNTYSMIQHGDIDYRIRSRGGV